jgi:hypothetical protein
MQVLGLILILINVGAIVGPIAGVVVVYRSNLQDLVVPPEVLEIVGNTINSVTSSTPNNPSGAPSNPDNNPSGGGNLALPQYVSSSYDPVARTVTAIFNFTNPFNFTISINDISADVQCHAHSFMLGHAAISNPVDVPPMQTADITVIFAWTVAAQEHFQTAHAGQTSINVDLLNITVNVSGISIETPETYNVDIPISQ